MARVNVQVPVPKVEEFSLRLARVPVVGDVLEFAEDYSVEELQGEHFVVRTVVFPIDVDGWPQVLPEPPVVILREP